MNTNEINFLKVCVMPVDFNTLDRYRDYLVRSLTRTLALFSGDPKMRVYLKAQIDDAMSMSYNSLIERLFTTVRVKLDDEENKQ